MRASLRWLVCGWLLCQAAALCSAPALFRAVAHASDAAHVTCTCPGARPGAACPMHSATAPVRAGGGLLLQNPCVPDSAALLLLVGGIGLPADAGVAPALVVAAARTAPAASALLWRADSPLSPPPRA
jgi:hypothetical protein